MPRSDEDRTVRPRWRWLVGSAVGVLLLWVAFFDSHSVQKRLRFRDQRAALTSENDSLRHQIEALEAKLQHSVPDSTIERIAREEYGMRRPEETVYRLK